MRPRDRGKKTKARRTSSRALVSYTGVMPERERGAVRPSSSFHEMECCVFEVLLLREGGRPGEPPTAAVTPFPLSHHPSEQSSLA